MTMTFPKKSAVKPEPGILKNDPGYRLLMALDFNDMIPFVISNIRRKGVMSFLFTLVNLGMLAFIVWYLISGLIGSQLTWNNIFRQSLFGIVTGSILLIPLHETLHGLAYRILGARSIKFGVDLQQFIFFVTADRFTVTRRELCFLAMTPFLVINLAGILISTSLLPQLTLLMAFVLLSHNIMCIGDFAIVNYVIPLKGRVFSFDEPELKKSYFYEEVARNPE